MSKLPVISGMELVKILVKYFGFFIVGRRGSHVSLSDGFKGIAIPLHQEPDKGTLNAILKRSEIEREEFLKYV